MVTESKLSAGTCTRRPGGGKREEHYRAYLVALLSRRDGHKEWQSKKRTCFLCLSWRTTALGSIWHSNRSQRLLSRFISLCFVTRALANICVVKRKNVDIPNKDGKQVEEPEWFA